MGILGVQPDSMGWVSLPDILKAGNQLRAQKNMPLYQIETFIQSKLLRQFIVETKSPDDKTNLVVDFERGMLLAEQVWPPYRFEILRIAKEALGNQPAVDYL